MQNGDDDRVRIIIGDALEKLKELPDESLHCVSETIPCVVLDPFAGSGTTGEVARHLGRRAILIDLNPLNERLMRKRCMTDVLDILSFGD